MRRKLVAILFADVAGYSRLMEADEVGTLERLKENRRTVVEPCIALHAGRIVKLMGDGILVEFASVVAAIECATALQASMATSTGQGFQYRIGVNLGDVIVEGDDIYGDGVNVAARLQALAPVGGIALSGTVHDQIEGKVAASFEDIGQHAVKNIERPVQVYVLRPPNSGKGPRGEWARNHATLAGLMEKNLPGESVRLSDVYTPLRAIRRLPFADLPKKLQDTLQIEFEKKGVDSGGEYYLASDLEELLVEWLIGRTERADAIRVVRGGPGSGKSSFAKRFCQAALRDPRCQAVVEHVLLFPLQHLPSLDGPIEQILGEYLTRAGLFPSNPLSRMSTFLPNRRLLIVLDGVDEIAKASETSARKTRELLHSLQKWLDLCNSNGVAVLALVIGRETAVQASTSDLGLAAHQQLHLLSYWNRDPTILSVEPLSDQRREWWAKWAKTKGLENELPASFNDPQIVDLSTEPLLLYLLASTEAYRANAEVFRDRGTIFEFLVNRVVANWHNRAGRERIEFPADQATIHLLEIIAVAAWSNGGRITTGEKVKEFCSRDQALDAEFSKLVRHRDLAQAVLSFYMRYGDDGDEAGIEFSHKSFVEYLVARFLCKRAAQLFFESAQVSDIAYSAWHSLFGDAPITHEIVDFMKGEVARWPLSRARLDKAADLVAALGSREVEFMQRCGPHEPKARSAAEALFAIVSAVASVANRTMSIGWKSKTDAALIVRRLSGLDRLHQWTWRTPSSLCSQEAPVFRRLLGYCDFSGQILVDATFRDANLYRANFANSDLRCAKFVDTVLAGASFRHADLRGTVFHGSNLTGADLSHADLRMADLSVANGVTLAQINSAICDRTTRLPALFEPPSSPAKDTPPTADARP